MNRDTIDLFGRFVPFGNDDKAVLHIDVTINGHVIKNQYVDPWAIALQWFDSESDPYRYGQSSSRFYLFSCSCGEPSCSGINDGIHVRVRKHSVEWRISKRYNRRAGYRFLPGYFFSFDRKQYVKAQRNFLFWLKMETDIDIDLLVDGNLGIDEFFYAVERQKVALRK